MNWFTIFRRRIGALFKKEELEARVNDEIRSHLEMQTQENIEAGMKPEEARCAALRQFGWVESIKEDCREQRRVTWLENLLQDVRFGARQLYKNPGFTTVGVLTLALGIGANTVMFSIVEGVLLRPLPYEQPGRLVQVWQASSPGKRNTVSPGAFLDWKEHNTVFEALSLFQNTDMNLTGGADPERISGLAMSASGLQILRARPLFGRTFAPDEDQFGLDKVVVLAHAFWQRRFGGQTNIVGRTIQLDDRDYTVVGVLPPHFLPLEKAAFVIPTGIAQKDVNERGADWLRVIGRLKPGVTIEQANAAMKDLSVQLRALYPPEKKDWGVTVVTMQEQMTGDIRPTLLVLVGAVGLVLLIACASVANLLLAKASGRQKEMALRAALGASRSRVVRQLLAESALLSVLGATLGVLVAFTSVGALTRLSAANLPRIAEIRPDAHVAGFALLVSLLATVGFGLAPAVQSARLNLNDTLKEGTRTSGTGVRNRVRNGLIISEVAVSFILLAGTGLLLDSFIRLSNVPSGINPHNVLTMQFSLPDKKYPDGEHRTAFITQVLQRVGNLSGVEAAGAIDALPFAGGANSTSFSVVGRPGQPEEGIDADFDFCTPDYFRAIGTPVRKGRFFDQHDRVGTTRVVLINEAFARDYFPNEDPIGQRIHLEVFTRKMDESWEIVGVVGDVHQRGLSMKPRPCVYRPQAFSFFGGSENLVVRTSITPLGLAEAVRKAVLEVDPNQPVANVRTMEDIMATSVAQRRLTLTLLGAFAGVALVLAMIGLYGVIAYFVSQRSREIGIRLAIGATRNSVHALVLLQGMKLAGIGLLLGIVGGLGLTRALTSQLYEVKASDQATFVAVSVTLGFVALLASWLPARRATKVDPMVALRQG